LVASFLLRLRAADLEWPPSLCRLRDHIHVAAASGSDLTCTAWTEFPSCGRLRAADSACTTLQRSHDFTSMLVSPSVRPCVCRRLRVHRVAAFA